MAGKNFSLDKYMASTKAVPDLDTEWIALEAIYINPKNFYPKPTPAQMEELVASIEANGILEPPAVVRDGDRYRLISGHSRIDAVHLLAIKSPDDPRWSKVLCRVLPPMTEEQELTAVIEANRQRIKANWVLAEEAIRLTKAYTKRKEAGEALPGRIRDRVAEDLQVNKTKLANLSAINNGLKVPGIIEAWKANRIPEAAALEIARMDYDTQCALMDWMIDKERSYTIMEVRKFSHCWDFCKKDCPEIGGFCPNAERMHDCAYHADGWTCAGCCKSCRHISTCPGACEYVRVERPSHQSAEDTAQADTDAPKRPADMPQGQLTICGWMPAATNPGPEPGWCVCQIMMDRIKPIPKALWWDGESWLFRPGGAGVGIEPLAWMRLPEYNYDGGGVS